MEALGSAGMSKKLKALSLETFSKETQPNFPEEKSTTKVSAQTEDRKRPQALSS